MKKGISLIVLVITIIVMIIIAGAIIVSLSTTNIIDQATEARDTSNVAEYKSALSLKFSTDLAEGEGVVLATDDNTSYVTELTKAVGAVPPGYHIEVATADSTTSGQVKIVGVSLATPGV